MPSAGENFYAPVIWFGPESSITPKKNKMFGGGGREKA
jgi:hypothetical protein